jgi:hypothetical protein
MPFLDWLKVLLIVGTIHVFASFGCRALRGRDLGRKIV